MAPAGRERAHLRIGLCLLALVLPGATKLIGAELPPGFQEELLVQGLDSPTAIDVLPDGRILVAEQRGTLRSIPPGGGAPTLVHALSAVSSQGERGLLGVVVDPDFSNNGYVYLFVTTHSGGLHNRIVRLHLEGDQAVGGETALFDFPVFSESIFHMGGAMRFAPDGTLFIGVGDHYNPETAQDLGLAFGKVHRLAADGSIPADNPFAGVGGALASIYAYGFRNPYSMDVDQESADLFVNDVGRSTWEEVNRIVPGGNFGWPQFEGPEGDPEAELPVYAYLHMEGACAITGGVFYPDGGSFPVDYWDRYLIIDLCAGWIRAYDLGTGEVSDFATGLEFPTSLSVDVDGALLYLARTSDGAGGTGKLYRISYSANPSDLPQIVEPPVDTVAGVGESANFSVVAAGATGYQWQRDGVDIVGADSPELVVENVTLADDGARFRVLVANSYGSVASAEATLAVTTNLAPVVAISSPLAASGYSSGATLTLSGSAADPEEGPVPAERLAWRIDLHHDAHTHPLMPPTSGFSTLDFVIPAEADHGDGLVWLEVVLAATDSEGRTGRTSSHIFPSASLAGSSPHVLALRGGDYLVSLELQNPLTGLPQTAISWPQTSDSGGFWFFGPENLEILLKVLDGTGFNGCTWVYFGALSNVEFDFFVVETRTGRLRTYSSPQGSQASFGDIEAYCDGTAAGAAAPLAGTATASNLDLLGGRFRLTVEWSSPWSGDSGVAAALPLTDQSGFFTFFEPSNLEMAVKMVDGSDFNGHFWVYWTALSNLETMLTVEDLWTTRVRSFPKAGLAFGAGADIQAFPVN